MGTALEAWLSDGGEFLTPWRVILWTVVCYLLGLGATAFAWPDRARSFLKGFADGWRNNLLEAVLRGVAGLAFVAASTTRAPGLSRMLGLFLVATAVVIAILPRLHGRIAKPAARFIFAIFPLFGLLAIGLAALVVWFIAGG